MLLETVARDGGFDLENLREHWMDAILECNAPFYGEVVTLYEPLACYRVHGRNLYAVNSINDTHFNLLLHTFEIKLDYFARRCQAWGIPFNLAAVRARSPWALECELILSKLASGARPTEKAYLYQTIFSDQALHRGANAPRSTDTSYGVDLWCLGWPETYCKAADCVPLCS